MRRLRFHETKLLKKVTFGKWEADNNLHEVKIMRRYHIQKREDYTAYNKLSRQIRDIARKIRDLPAEDPLKKDATSQLLKKLYDIGLIPAMRSLENADHVNASSFCRRRLSFILVKSHMAENLKAAVTFVEHGHVRVGTSLITDSAFVVSRKMEDFVTWANTSAIRKHVQKYNEQLDDSEFV